MKPRYDLRVAQGDAKAMAERLIDQAVSFAYDPYPPAAGPEVEFTLYGVPTPEALREHLGHQLLRAVVASRGRHQERHP